MKEAACLISLFGRGDVVDFKERYRQASTADE